MMMIDDDDDGTIHGLSLENDLKQHTFGGYI